MKKNRLLYISAVMLFLCCFLSGCGKEKEPVVLTMWHVYGSQTDSPMNAMVSEFNQTVGKEQGITIQVTQISNTNAIHEAVLAGARKEPGAASLPDIFISYPKTVLAMTDDSVLVNFDDYFTEEEKKDYLPEFVQEGYVNDRLLVFPVAKSTELLFVDKTLFDRFAAETGADIEDLSSWEKMFKLSVEYYNWTDAQTPDVPFDGKALMVHDYSFNYLQLGVETLGGNFFDGDKINFSKELKQVWMPFAKAAIQGGVWLQEGYATEAIRTGDVIVSVASSASVLYYEDIVTYPNNVSEDIEVVARPVPVWNQNNKLVMQRGAGLCVTKSTTEREKAAMIFIKWLTAPENNVRFVTQAGYMPVTDGGFDKLPDSISSLENRKYRSLYQAFLETQSKYEFYTTPQISTYLSLEDITEDNFRSLLRSAREEYLTALSTWEDLDTPEGRKRAEQLAETLAETYYGKYQALYK